MQLRRQVPTGRARRWLHPVGLDVGLDVRLGEDDVSAHTAECYATLLDQASEEAAGEGRIRLSGLLEREVAPSVTGFPCVSGPHVHGLA